MIIIIKIIIIITKNNNNSNKIIIIIINNNNKNNNKPKEYPNSNDMLGGFLRTGFGWVRDLNNSRNLTGGDWEINLKHTWRNPPKNFYEATAIWETNVKNSWQNPPQNLFWSNSRLPKKPQETVRPMWRTVWGTLQITFWEAKTICCKEPQKTSVSFAPRPLVWLKTPKLMPLKKMQKRVEELGDKCKEVMGEPSTKPFGTPKRICPRRPRGITKLAQPWWNLGETFLGPWWTFHRTSKDRTFWQPKTESPKAILPRDLYYRWRPQSYCCWGIRYISSVQINYVYISILAVNILLPNWLLL